MSLPDVSVLIGQFQDDISGMKPHRRNNSFRVFGTVLEDISCRSFPNIKTTDKQRNVSYLIREVLEG